MSQVVGLDMVTGMGFIGLEPGRLYKIGQSPKLKDQTASGNPLLLNSAEAPLTALTLYGWSKQDGTPTPEDPVPIVSAGSVMTTGAQLIDTSLIPPYDKWDGEFSGVYLKDERTWFLKIPNNNSVAKVWNEDFTKAWTWGELMPTLSVGDIITFGQNVDLNETINIGYNSDSGLVIRQGDSITVTQNFLDSLAQFYGVDGAGTTCERVEIQINRGTIALPWEPYTGGQPAANPYEGEIDVTVQGGNLFPNFITDKEYPLGSTVKVNSDGSVTVHKVAGESISMNAKYHLNFGTYTLSNGLETGAPVYFQVENMSTLNNGKNTKEFASGEYKFYFYSNNESEYDGTLYPMLNAGSTALPYMPYKTPQTLTAQTPGGLPGIPVSSGGNYTDESGQQWICDEVDFKRGVYVQRVWKGTFDGSEDEAWRTYDSINLEGFYCADALPEFMKTRASLCNQLIPYDSISSDNAIRLGANNKYIYCTRSSFYDPSLEDGGLANWKAHLAAHPLEVMTYLETPIETDLTAEEMAAYKALHTYSPATTVSNDAGAWMGVGYKK